MNFIEIIKKPFDVIHTVLLVLWYGFLISISSIFKFKENDGDSEIS